MPAGYRLEIPLDLLVTRAATANEELRPLTNPNTNLGFPLMDWINQGEPNAVTAGRFRDAMHARDARLSFTGS